MFRWKKCEIFYGSWTWKSEMKIFQCFFLRKIVGYDKAKKENSKKTLPQRHFKYNFILVFWLFFKSKPKQAVLNTL